MGGSRRKYKRSRTKVRVALPKKNPNVFKPAFTVPPKFKSIVDLSKTKWDDQGSVLENYKSFGVVSNPNLLGVRSRTSKIIESESLQLPVKSDGPIDEFEPIDSGSELEEDDVKTALGKQRADGKSAPLQPLTAMQRLHVRALVEKYGDDYKVIHSHSEKHGFSGCSGLDIASAYGSIKSKYTINTLLYAILNTP